MHDATNMLNAMHSSNVQRCRK